mmetsp:Transcript_14007/g.24628  ORF Transcript_14007/g.24628 Transcript_14007/m.24628 type:complete len:80 (+) Transcript_14007:568-807(+)
MKEAKEMPLPVNFKESAQYRNAPTTSPTKLSLEVRVLFGFSASGNTVLSRIKTITGHKLTKTVRSVREHLKEVRLLAIW